MSKTCCDFGCNQGRDCPARIERLASAARMTTASDDGAELHGAKGQIVQLGKWLALSVALTAMAATVAGFFG